MCVYIVSKAQVEFLQDQQVSTEQSSGHGHVTNSLTDDGYGQAAAVQLRQADPHVQALTCKTQSRDNQRLRTHFHLGMVNICNV